MIHLAAQGRRVVAPVLPRAFGVMMLTVSAIALTGCAIPRAAATPQEVLRGTEAEDSAVQVISVNREALTELRQWPRPAGSVRHNWPSTGAQATARLIRAGDSISLAVWDSQQDSLLASPEQRMVQMQNLTVSQNGRIFVPYVGEVRVSGMSPDAARRDIESQMRVIVPDGQIQLSHSPGSANSIDVVTGVASPGRIPMPESSPSILSVLAQAGGIAPSLRNPLVRLNRGGHGYAIPARVLFAEPSRDIMLRGGDRILVEEDQRNFIALGASGNQEVVYFAREEITALDALSSVGGLSSDRANLRGLMILREYPQSALGQAKGPTKDNVIFTFDLSNAEGLFAASNFHIAPGDVVLATESTLPAFLQMVALFRTVRSL